MLACLLLSPMLSSCSDSQVNETLWIQVLTFLGDTTSCHIPWSFGSYNLTVPSSAIFSEPYVFSLAFYDIVHVELSVSHVENLYDRVMEFGLKDKSNVFRNCLTYLSSSCWIRMELSVLVTVLF